MIRTITQVDVELDNTAVIIMKIRTLSSFTPVDNKEKNFQTVLINANNSYNKLNWIGQVMILYRLWAVSYYDNNINILVVLVCILNFDNNYYE